MRRQHANRVGELVGVFAIRQFEIQDLLFHAPAQIGIASLSAAAVELVGAPPRVAQVELLGGQTPFATLSV